MVLGIIVACEIAFWVLVALGLGARYLLRWPRIGAVLLVLSPIVDLVLLLAVSIDLRGGGTATFAHGLAAIYLGFSVVYGHRMIRWADVRFAHRFADGPSPEKVLGRAYTRLCWHDVLRTAAAVGIAAVLLWGLSTIAAAGSDTTALFGTYQILAIILGVDVIWAIGYTVWPRKGPSAPAGT